MSINFLVQNYNLQKKLKLVFNEKFCFNNNKKVNMVVAWNASVSIAKQQAKKIILTQGQG